MSERDTTILQLVGQLQASLAEFDRATLAEVIGKLISLRAPMGEQWQQLATIAGAIGEIGLARQAAELFVESFDGSPAARYQQAAVLAELGAMESAYALLRQLPAGAPDPVSNAYSRANALLNLGRGDEARPLLDEVVRAAPQVAPAWLMLAMATDLSEDAALAERLVAAERNMRGMAPAQLAPYYYALGKTHADRSEHTLAFKAFARGAQSMRNVVTHDRARDREEARQATLGYSVERIAALARRQQEPTGRTIFVTGLPRSGTTLVEQILAGHSAVAGGGEINRLPLLAGDVDGSGYPALETYVEKHGSAAAARLWHHWLDELYGATGRVVDKSLNTSRHLGLAAVLLPEAPLVWITRDPLDCAWSCFRTNFIGVSIPWSYDLEDIANHFQLEGQLLARWRALLGDRLLVVSYEALVAHPESQIRRILVHCGLTEEPSVFAPHLTRRPVATASMTQVRRPISADAVGSAEPYRAFLEPFVRAYSAASA